MLYSNVDDLANFLSLFFREGPRGGKQVLGSSSLLEEALPMWQKYIGRYVITDPNAIPTITFSEFDVSIINKKFVITIPEVRPGSIVWAKEVPLEHFGNSDFKIAGGSFGNKFITFESSNDGSMRLKWKHYIFKATALSPTIISGPDNTAL